MPIKVAIVGAGIAGLTAAHRLKERGYEVAIFEQRMHVGGKLGAHPRRIKVDPPPNTTQSSGNDALDPAMDYQAVIELWRKSLDEEVLPPELRRVMDRFRRREQARFCRGKKPSDSSAREKGAEAPGLPEMKPKDEADPKIELIYSKDRSEDTDPDDVERQLYLGVVRGWKVTMRDKEVPCSFNIWIHQNEWGRLRLEITDDFYHEHCYHMYLNWYRNFWQLMREIGQDRSHAFVPFNDMGHVFAGTAAVAKRLRVLTSIGSIDAIGDNLLSGVASVPDLLLWFYSLTDLVSEPWQSDRYLDMASVQGFLRSRWHATEQSALLHEYVLSKAFAIPTYLSSAYAYKNYIEYGIRQPQPLVWVLKGNTYRALFLPLVTKLLGKDGDATIPCQLKLGRKITSFEMDDNGRAGRLYYRPSDIRDREERNRVGELRRSGQAWQDLTDPDLPENDEDDGERMAVPRGGEQVHSFDPDYIIVAVPPKALADIASRNRKDLPSLNAVRKLQSGVTAALDLHFNRKIPGIPKRHVILRGSVYGLTIFDNSQVWENDPSLRPDTKYQKAGGQTQDNERPYYCTCLSVAATDFYKIAGMGKREAIQVIIEDLKRFIPFSDNDIDVSRSYLQMNDGEPMFLNEVGSEPWRPGPCTEIPNLFVAGDFCNNEIGIVSVEGAVVSGLLAARAVQAQLREDRQELAADAPELRPIPILKSGCYPRLNAQVMKVALTPLAAAAKAWSRREEFADYPDRALNPRELQAMVEDTLAGPGRIAADLLQLAGEAARWSAELPYHDE